MTFDPSAPVISDVTVTETIVVVDNIIVESVSGLTEFVVLHGVEIQDIDDGLEADIVINIYHGLFEETS